ncbi:MAG: phospho-N-acetylmuramoyl-pentapeptide-transferase [Saprospiraceae bacterium]|nr:phospho-N-acetylmuramoyl-pentapeptide-transferase [Saprospiraceae bacterium]
MLYYLFEYINQHIDLPGSGLFKYISFRAGGALIFSLIISILYGNRIINFLRRKQIGETVRDLGLAGQKEKTGTPTMGGIIIILAILIPCLLWARLDNVYILLMLFVTIWLSLIGFLDDYIKVFQKNKEGLKAKTKLAGQVICGLVVALTLMYNKNVQIRLTEAEAIESGYEIIEKVSIKDNAGNANTLVHARALSTNVPFVKGNVFDYSKLIGWMGERAKKATPILYVLLVIFILVSVSNGANLTDGIDGLATGVSGIVGVTLIVFAYVSGNAIFADYLGIYFIPNSGELVIFTSCFIGACIGFLWWNSFPATVFMGDTGSLALGGVIATLAIVLRKELLVPVFCGIFLIENFSVVLQVAYFKYTKKKYGEGRRIFRMSPLHHHYQKGGMHEVKIVNRFWITAIFLAVLAIITLKIR